MEDHTSPADDPVDAAWKALLEQWSDPERHRSFVTLAAMLSRLPDVAARYRSVESDPDRREAAEAAKKLIVAQAMAVVDTTPRTSREQVRRSGLALVPIAALGLMLATSWMLSALAHNRVFVSPVTLAVEILVVALLPWRRILG